MTEIVDPIVRQALENLFTPTGTFYINHFDQICESLNVIPPKGHRDRLRLLHCTKYRDMNEDVREEVGRLVYETLNSPGFNIQIDRAVELGHGKVAAITGRRDDANA